MYQYISGLDDRPREKIYRENLKITAIIGRLPVVLNAVSATWAIYGAPF